MYRDSIDSILCAVGGGFIWLGAYLDAVTPYRLSVEALVKAEQQSILEVHFQLTETLYITPADCLQLFGGLVGVWGVGSMIYKRILKWYNSKSK
jgi:hypothetical protein